MLALHAFAAPPVCACSTWAKSRRAAVRSSLRDLAAHQRSYYDDHHRYATRLEDLSFPAGEGRSWRYSASEGVTVVLERGDERGWVARADDPELGAPCRAGVGPEAPPGQDSGPSDDDVRISCDPLPLDPALATLGAIRIVSLALVVVLAIVASAAEWKIRTGAGMPYVIGGLAITHPLFWNADADCGVTATVAAMLWAAGAMVCLRRQSKARWRAAPPDPA